MFKKKRQVYHRCKLRRNDFYDFQLLQLLYRSIENQHSAWMRSRYFRYRSKGIGDAAPTSHFAKNEWTCTGLHCLPSSDLLYIGLKLFPTWECLWNNFVPNWHEVLTSIIYFRPTWSEVKFLKSHTPKDNFIPIWDEVKILTLITFRQVVGKFFAKINPRQIAEDWYEILISASVQLALKLPIWDQSKLQSLFI